MLVFDSRFFFRNFFVPLCVQIWMKFNKLVWITCDIRRCSEVDQCKCKSHSVKMIYMIKKTFYYSNFQSTNQLNNYFNSLILI